MRIQIRSILILTLFFSGCSPIKTSLHDEKYQWELTIHEVQTNLDDLRHDTNCVQTELQILEGRVKSFETALFSLKQQEIEKQQGRIEQLSHQLQQLEKKWSSFEKKEGANRDGWEQLSSHANETNMALSQFKERMEELEKEIISQNRRLESLVKIKGSLENLSKSLKADSPKTYKVRPGDTLEKIAKMHRVDVSSLKQINQLQSDLIVVDQELKIP